MAIVETVLGPNSSLFTTTGTAETPTTMLAAISAYIVSKGWTVIDTAAPPTSMTVGHVFRAPQEDSTTVFKTVQIGLSTSGINLIPWESWNATTHVGTNAYNYANQGTSASAVQVANSGLQFPNNTLTSVEGVGVVVFAHPRWLAVRARANTLTWSGMLGSFEISKDYGEAASILANVFITTGTTTGYPGGNYAGFFGVPALVSTPSVTTTTAATPYMNVLTAVGMPASSLTMSYLTAGPVPNFPLTMQVAEQSGAHGGYGVKNIRGRVFGAKLLGGQQVWNDMDTVQVPIDSKFFHTTGGTSTAHHVIATGCRFLIPA